MRESAGVPKVKFKFHGSGAKMPQNKLQSSYLGTQTNCYVILLQQLHCRSLENEEDSRSFP